MRWQIALIAFDGRYPHLVRINVNRLTYNDLQQMTKRPAK
ncbi:hypothetical protein VCRA2113O140_160067 [Vibrio crassostreae]|nr:hypothetical protein VCRA2113O140_160067 [Vibrio crassostreae]CAK3235367.1 hypothetical protein VCRA2121O152_160067 [Vibrio crassostreae]